MLNKRFVIVSLCLLAVSKIGLAQHPDANGFQMPYRQVLKRTPDRFVTVYARQRGEADPTSPSGASFRSGMDYYAQCLEIRTRLRMAHLPSSRRRQWHHLKSALDRWTDLYYQVYGCGMGGTFWASASAQDRVAQEKTLAQIETALRRPHSVATQSKRRLQYQLQSIEKEIGSLTKRQVYTDHTVRQFSHLRLETQHATVELQRAALPLPASCDGALLTCLKQICADVKDCAAPGNG